MTDSPHPALTPRGEAARDERLARQAQALRENLRRRKAQARGRGDSGPSPDGPGQAPPAAVPAGEPALPAATDPPAATLPGKP